MKQITIGLQYDSYDEEYYFWPGFGPKNIGKTKKPNFDDGEADVLVGAPSKDDMRIMYDEIDFYDEGADALEEYLELMYEHVTIFHKKLKVPELIDTVEKKKIVCKSIM